MLANEYPRLLLALCIWREARGQSTEAKRAVGWVIRNRTLDQRWPSNTVGVILQPYQFSCFNRDDPNVNKYPRFDDKDFEECCSVVEWPGLDPTKGANHYHSLPNGSAWPNWAIESKRVMTIGPFKFYKL